MNIFISSFNVSGESSRDPMTRIRLAIHAGSEVSFERSRAFGRALRFRPPLTTALSRKSRLLLRAGRPLLDLVGRHRPSKPFPSERDAAIARVSAAGSGTTGRARSASSAGSRT
ncbi:MAG: hypothetical protein M9894_01330 [Planctomycetes bacterium]|nr:hypothetical protein [Planctomycetota bacterium]